MYTGYPLHQRTNYEKDFKIHMDIFVGAGFAEECFRSFVAGYPNIHRCCHMYSDYNYCMDVLLAQEADYPAFLRELHACVPGIERINMCVISDVLKPPSRHMH